MNPNEKLKKIKLVITDVDGVLTDGRIHYGENSEKEVMKSFNVKDGLGTKMLIENGVQVAVLSGRDSSVLRKRISDLGIKHFILGQLEKESACYELMKSCSVTPEETAFIGDDSIDLPAFEVCGLSFAVGDAFDYIKDMADIVLKRNGGCGAFREMSDMILKAQGKEDVYASAKGFLKTAKKMVQ